MTPEQFKSARRALGYSQKALAAEWGMGNNAGRTVRRWESEGDARPVNPIAMRVVQWMLDGYRPPQWPD